MILEQVTTLDDQTREDILNVTPTSMAHIKRGLNIIGAQERLLKNKNLL